MVPLDRLGWIKYLLDCTRFLLLHFSTYFSEMQVVLDGLNFHYQTSVHLPLTSAIDKSQRY